MLKNMLHLYEEIAYVQLSKTSVSSFSYRSGRDSAIDLVTIEGNIDHSLHDQELRKVCIHCKSYFEGGNEDGETFLSRSACTFR